MVYNTTRRRLDVTAAEEQTILTGLISAFAYVVTIDASQVVLSYPSGDNTRVDVLMTFTNSAEAAAVAWAARSTTFDTNIEEQLNAQVTLSDLPRMTTILLVPPASPPEPPLPPTPPFPPPAPSPSSPAAVSNLLEGEELGDNVATGGSDDDDDGMSTGVAVAVAIACIFALLCILAASYAFVMLRRFKQTNLVIKRTHNSAPETAHAVPARFEAASIVQESRRMDVAIQDRIQTNGDGGRVADTLRQTESAQQDATSGPTIDVVIPEDAIVMSGMGSPGDVKAGDANTFRDRLPEMRT